MSAPRRFTVTNPCPVCGGWEHMPRGRSVRCSGFLDSSGPYAHCTREERAGGLPVDDRTEPPSYLHRVEGDCNCGDVHVTAPVLTLPSRPSRIVRRQRSRIVERYVYRDKDGTPSISVTRQEPKEFRQWHYAGGDWSPGLNGQAKIPYHLDKLVAAQPKRPVWWCEGEKDADRLASLDLLATTFPGGAGKLDEAGARELTGRWVIVLVDNDDAGRAGAQRVAAMLVAAGANVRLLELPELPDKGDVSDWLDAGHSRQELIELALKQPTWHPTSGEAAVLEPIAEDEDDLNERLILPAFPLGALPPPLRELAEAAESSGSFPADFVAVMGLGALMTAGGGRHRIEVEPGWWERLIGWFGVVAGPGTGKSPSFKAAFDPLTELEREWWRRHYAELDDWKDECADIPRGQPKPPPPTPRRAVIGDSTMERLIRLLADNPQGLAMANDELRGLVYGLNQYKGGRGSDRTHLLSLWTGQDVVVDRVGENGQGRNIRAELPALCIAGGIQPGVLSALDGEDGLPSRFQLAYPPPRRLRPTGVGILPSVLAAWAGLLREMVARRPEELTTVQLSDTAATAMLDARLHYADIAHDATRSPLVVEFASKAPGHMARLALAFYVARVTLQPATPPVVGIAELTAAREVTDYFLRHAAALPMHRPNFLAGVATQRADEGVARLVDWLRGRQEQRATRRELQMGRVAGCRTPAEIDRLLERYEAIYPGRVEKVARPSGLPTVIVRLP